MAIAAAVILGIFVTLYLGGLIGQLNAGYREWLSQDGLGGGAVMSGINFSPLRCVAYSLGANGRGVALSVVIISAAVFVYAKLHDKFGKGERDERNFTRAKEGTYGTAAWMSDKEMRQALEVAAPENAHGVILGEKNGKVICLPVSTKLNKHIFVCGASGAMKSRAIVRNLLFQAIKRGESVVLTDSKAELYDNTAELFRQNGYLVKVFNLLVSPDHSDSWNCMANLAGDTLTTQILTDVIISNTAKAPYNLFAQASDTVRAGIVLGLGTRLQIMQNEAIRRITGHSDIDLAKPGKTKCAYFVILSDQESSTEFLSSLFFSFLFIQLTGYADSTPERRCAIPVNVVFEEFNNIGKLDSYPRRLSVARSREIQICHVVQSLDQFQNRYLKNEWAEIIGSCDTQLMLGVTEQEGAEFFSLRSGDSTVRVNSTMTVKQTIALTQLVPQYRETDGIGRRRLLTPDEVLRFPNDELLIILRGQNVLRARKFDYLEHPFAKRLILSSIFDYNPQLVPHTGSEEPDAPRTEMNPALAKLFAASKPPDEF
jgi:type IV secretion system protein VirD4